MTLTTVVAVATVLFFGAYSRSLRDTSYVTGWVLVATLLFLALYNLRKKLTYPPLGSSSTWLQLHLYVGLLSIVVFAIHIGFTTPGGPLEIGLATLYIWVAASGLIGLFFSRFIPARLSVRGQEVLFERIPMFRRQLRDRSEELVLEAAKVSNSLTLSDFYRHRLAGFFDRPAHFWHHLVQSSRPLHRLMDEFNALDRYLDEQERQIAGQLAELIKSKDTLDYHRAMQGVLKGWLFVHLPLTYALFMFIAVHAVLVHAFSGSLR
jgi:thiosulfate reductase cytochrome b subunit